MLEFIAVAIVVIVAPGPDFALTVRNALGGGGRATVFTGLLPQFADSFASLAAHGVAFGVRLATERR